MLIYCSNLSRSFTMRVFASVLLGVLPLKAVYAFQDTGHSSYSLSGYSQSSYFQPGYSGESSRSNVAFKKSGQVIIRYGYRKPHRQHSYYGQHHKTYKKVHHYNKHHSASRHHHYKKKPYGIHLKSGGKRHYQSNHSHRHFKYKRNRHHFSRHYSKPHHKREHHRYYGKSKRHHYVK